MQALAPFAGANPFAFTACSRPLSAAFRRWGGVRVIDPPVERSFLSTGVQRRSLVSATSMRAMANVPVFRAAIGAASFQEPWGCDRAAERHQALIAAALVETGAAEPIESPGSVHLLDLTVDDLIEMNRRHGPLRMQLFGSLPPAQGGDKYPQIHSTVLLASIAVPRGLGVGAQEAAQESYETQTHSPVGVILDGSDEQKNEGMRELHAWMQAEERLRGKRVSDLTQDDFDQFAKERGDDARRILIRAVDLATFLDKAVRGYRESSPMGWDSVVCHPAIRLKQPLLDERMVPGLDAALVADLER